MDPLQKVEFAVSFAASLSAWWLLLAVPVVTGLAALFYIRQSRDVARGHAIGLTILRVLIMLAVLFLAFRPSLIRRVTSTYPGRLLFVLDDSGSMGVPDPALPDRDAARLARKARNLPAGREAPMDNLREDVLTVERWLTRFEQFGRSTDRNQDAFWREAERVQVEVNEKLDRIAEKALALSGGGTGTNRFEDTATRCRDLKTSLSPLFTGHEPPAADFIAKMHTSLSELASLLDDAQGDADAKALTAGDAALKEAVAGARQAPRLGLVYDWLLRQREAFIANTRGLSLWVQPLSAPTPVAFDKASPTPAASATRETDLSGALLKYLTEDNPFPLAGIVVFSDGRNLGETSIEEVARAASLRSVPIFSAGVGGTEEPPDVAVRDVYHAPFGVVGKPLGILTSVKAVLPTPENLAMELLSGKTVLTNDILEIKGPEELQRRPVFTPTAEGLQRFTMRVGSAKSEVVPQQNNSRDLLIRVRQEQVRVLFLDWKPRWESRFFLNILNRLDYLDVNSIIGMAQPRTQIRRGVGKGMWPENLEALKLYDLIILGDLPPAPAALTDADWQQLVEYVNGGGSLVILGTGRQDPLPPAAAKALLPSVPRKAATPPPSDTASLQLTRVGRHHPVTRSLQGVIPTVDTVASERLRDDTVVLLQTGDGRALVSTRFVEKGKTLFVDTDRFWRRFNASSLDAHTAMIMSMTDWAVEARRPQNGKPQPDLCRYSSRESIQAWLVSDGTTNQIVEARNGDRVVSARAIPAHPGATLASAVFETLDPGDWILSRRGGESTPDPIRVIDQSRELNDLSRHEAWLRALSESTGGSYAEFTETGRTLNQIQPRNRVEHRERVWTLWHSGWVLAGLIVLLTLEWVWRKLAGLV